VTVVVELEGLEVRGRHGALEEEREHAQRFLFDVRMELSDEPARSDRLEDTVDYRDVVAVVRELCEGRRYHLLEALAFAVASELIDRFALVAVRVRVRKPDVALDVPVEWTAATVELGRAI
jgi:7,8-dihydroneopterin aldolase/epimerase/oxygenase